MPERYGNLGGHRQSVFREVHIRKCVCQYVQGGQDRLRPRFCLLMYMVHCSFCPTLPGQVEIWQKWHSSLAAIAKYPIFRQQTLVRHAWPPCMCVNQYVCVCQYIDMPDMVCLSLF